MVYKLCDSSFHELLVELSEHLSGQIIVFLFMFLFDSLENCFLCDHLQATFSESFCVCKIKRWQKGVL